MEQIIKVGSWTNHGKVLFIDNISELCPDPLCKVSSTKLCSHNLSELVLIEKPQSEIDKEIKIKELKKLKFDLTKKLQSIEKEILSLIDG